MASLKIRNGFYWAQWYVGSKQKRASLNTDSLQVAKARLREIEDKLARGLDNPLPTRTPIGVIVGAYVAHIRTRKTAKSAQTDVYYLRQMFGPCCPEVEVTSRTITPATAKRPPKPGTKPRDVAPIEAPCVEQVTTAQVADFIARMVRAKGLKPKTANRYREILCRLFNWAMREGRIRTAGDVNPIVRVDRYRESAPEIRYLTLPQIDEQLAALEGNRRKGGR